MDVQERKQTGIRGVDRSAASEFLRTEDLVIVVVGNAELLCEDLKKLGEVEEIFYVDFGGAVPPQHEH